MSEVKLVLHYEKKSSPVVCLRNAGTGSCGA